MPNRTWFKHLPELVPPPPLRTIVRSARDRLQPPRQVPFSPTVSGRQRRMLASGGARHEQLNPIVVEERPGQIPTIVIGGFVPGPMDATYLQRGLFLRHGSTYHVQYSNDGFSQKLFEAQLDDLVEELSEHAGTPPVIFAVSFGAGLVVQWLRTHAERGFPPKIAGTVLVSPVVCTADLLEPGAAKASTLLGRMMKGFRETPDGADGAKIEAWVEKSRQLMVKMFESGAQNKVALRRVLTRREVVRIRDNVIDSMRRTTARGARERTGSLDAMPSPADFETGSLPLHEAPALVLYAEKESSIMVDNAPSRRAFEAGVSTFFPGGEFAVVSNDDGTPVQHASLLFHHYNFDPHFKRFYRRLRRELPGTRRLRHTLARYIRPAHAAHRRKALAAARAACETADGGLAVRA